MPVLMLYAGYCSAMLSEIPQGGTRAENPYNTYARTGLPPTPIANPGAEAMKVATARRGETGCTS